MEEAQIVDVLQRHVRGFLARILSPTAVHSLVESLPANATKPAYVYKPEPNSTHVYSKLLIPSYPNTVSATGAPSHHVLPTAGSRNPAAGVGTGLARTPSFAHPVAASSFRTLHSNASSVDSSNPGFLSLQGR